MTKNNFWATMPKSELSIPAQVLIQLKRKRLVYFVIRRATDEQWEDLYDILGPSLVTRIPLKKEGHHMIFCRPRHRDNDYLDLDDYRFLLKTVFGPKCRIPVRMIHCDQVEVKL